MAAAKAAAGERCRTTTRTQKTNTRTTNQDGTASGRRVSSPWLQQNTASEGKCVEFSIHNAAVFPRLASIRRRACLHHVACIEPSGMKTGSAIHSGNTRHASRGFTQLLNFHMTKNSASCAFPHESKEKLAPRGARRPHKMQGMVSLEVCLLFFILTSLQRVRC